MNPLFHDDFSISDSLRFVRKSVLIYETIIANTVQVKLTPAVKGTYTVKLFAADADVTKDAALATLNNVTVSNNPVLKAIKVVDEFKQNEIAANGESGYKKVEFVNVNGESIDVTCSGLEVSVNGQVASVGLYTANTDGEPGAKLNDSPANTTSPIKFIKVKGAATAGAGSFTLQAKGDNGSAAYQPVPVTVVDEAHLATASFDATDVQVNPIINDTFAEEKTADTLEAKVENGVSYTLIPVSFKNQYTFDQTVTYADIMTEKKVTVKIGTVDIADTQATTELAKLGYDVKLYTKNAATGTISVASNSDAVNYIGVHAKKSSDTDPTAAEISIEAQIGEAATAEKLASITATPRTERTISKITELKADTTTTLAGNGINFTIKAEDQYGKEIPKGYFKVEDADTDDDIEFSTDSDTSTTATDVEKTITLTPKTTAESKDYNVQIKVDAKKQGETQPFANASSPLTESVTITVKTALDVKSLRFNNKLSVTETDAAAKDGNTATAIYDVTGDKAFYVPADTSNSNLAYAIGIEALDKDGNVVSIPADKYDGIAKVTITDSDGKNVTNKENARSGAVSIDSTKNKVNLTFTTGNDTSEGKFKDGDIISFTLKTTSASGLGLELPISLKVSTKAPEVKTDIKPVDANSTADSTGKLTDVSAGVNGTYLDTTGTRKQMKLGVQGVDQYGILRNVADNKLNYTVVPSTIATISSGTIKPNAVGKGEIRITGVGSGIAVPLEITAEDVALALPKAETSTEPVGAASLTYNGEEQQLITTAGQATGGTLKYSLDQTTWEENSTKIKGGNAGKYTVYYKVFGDSTHADSEVVSIEVTIGQVAIEDSDVSSTNLKIGKLADESYYVSADKVQKLKKEVEGTWNATGEDGSIVAIFTPTEGENWKGSGKKSGLSIEKTDAILKSAPSGVSVSSTTIEGLESGKKYYIIDRTGDAGKEKFYKYVADSTNNWEETSNEADAKATAAGATSYTATAGHVYDIIEVPED